MNTLNTRARHVRSTVGTVVMALMHGNTCLAAGQFAEAIAAFHQARELNPKHPYVTARLAEVERQQQAAGATPPVIPPV